MLRRTARGMAVAGLLCLAGCLHPATEKIDAAVCDLAAHPWDLQPIEHANLSAQPASSPTETKEGEGKEKSSSRLTVPDDLLPAGKIPDVALPRLPDAKDPKRKEKEEARNKALGRLFPTLPPLGEEPPDLLGPEGRPLTLSDLQRLALANSPLIKQAVARVKEAEGAAVQAGLPPNPNIGYEADTIGTAGGPGYQGGFLEQKVIVSNKLQLARAVAAMDLRNAQVALFRAQTDLATHVRGNYFALLVARESVRINRALVKFTSEVYQNQVKQVLRGGIAAPYEPMYLRALATQARGNLIQARNRRSSAWKQLAASLGLPGMASTQIAGRLDIPVPVFIHKDVLAHVLAHHTDVRTAENALQQAHYSLRHAQIVPVPDPTFRLMVQKDRTGPPYEVSPSLQLLIPLPVWDRNQGGIMQAEGALVRLCEEPHRVRAELTRTLADAFERYETNRVILGYYRDQILPDLVRVYRGVYARYQTQVPARPGEGAPGVGRPVPGFNDLVVAQQNLARAIETYVTTLGLLWQAVVDVADLLQTKDLFGVKAPTEAVAEIPDLEKLAALPCCHPCSPLPGAHQTVMDAGWPAAEPALPATPDKASVDKLPPPRPVPPSDGR